ncbi:MAG TPA: hypothetical protein VL133_15595, partial [Devosia sp.]|nr:hypothetical protein [Devosia sp.]
MPLRSFRHIGQISAASLLCALVFGGSAVAQTTLGNGDGSDTDNFRLKPGVYPAVPLDPLPADFGGLREHYDPYFNIDWSVAMRGAYTKTGDGERFDVIMA